VFPKPEHAPSRSSEARIGVAIANNVRLDLLAPPLGIGFWPRGVIRAPVPEASIHEDCHAQAREHNVGPPTQPGQHLAVYEKAQSHPVQPRTQS
jgi:hypothetical protein